jgi:hypothetical protein
MVFQRVCTLGLLLTTTTNGMAAQAGSQTGDMPANMRTVLAVEVNRDNLASVQRTLGPVAMWHTGDAAESEYHWCYRVGAGDQATTIRFGSSGEFGGPDHTVQHIRIWRGVGPADDTGRCSPLNVTARIQTPGGLRLGIDRRVAEQLLGRPTRVAGATIEYEWATEQLLAPTNPNYTMWNARRAECFDGKAPFTYVGGFIRIVFDAHGASEVLISRSNNGIC